MVKKCCVNWIFLRLEQKRLEEEIIEIKHNDELTLQDKETQISQLKEENQKLKE